MWSDRTCDRYWWHQMRDQFDEFIFELAKAEDEEEISLYLLNLHKNSKDDFNGFSQVEQETIQKFLEVLCEETTGHRTILAEIIQEAVKLRESHEKSSPIRTVGNKVSETL